MGQLKGWPGRVVAASAVQASQKAAAAPAWVERAALHR